MWPVSCRSGSSHQNLIIKITSANDVAIWFRMWRIPIFSSKIMSTKSHQLAERLWYVKTIMSQSNCFRGTSAFWVFYHQNHWNDSKALATIKIACGVGSIVETCHKTEVFWITKSWTMPELCMNWGVLGSQDLPRMPPLDVEHCWTHHSMGILHWQLGPIPGGPGNTRSGRRCVSSHGRWCPRRLCDSWSNPQTRWSSWCPVDRRQSVEGSIEWLTSLFKKWCHAWGDPFLAIWVKLSRHGFKLLL